MKTMTGPEMQHVIIRKNWPILDESVWSVVPASMRESLARIFTRERIPIQVLLLEQVRMLPEGEQPFAIEEAFERLEAYDSSGIYDWAPTYVLVPLSQKDLREIVCALKYSKDHKGFMDKPGPLSQEEVAALKATRESIRTGAFMRAVQLDKSCYQNSEIELLDHLVADIVKSAATFPEERTPLITFSSAWMSKQDALIAACETVYTHRELVSGFTYFDNAGLDYGTNDYEICALLPIEGSGFYCDKHSWVMRQVATSLSKVVIHAYTPKELSQRKLSSKANILERFEVKSCIPGLERQMYDQSSSSERDLTALVLQTPSFTRLPVLAKIFCLIGANPFHTTQMHWVSGAPSKGKVPQCERLEIHLLKDNRGSFSPSIVLACNEDGFSAHLSTWSAGDFEPTQRPLETPAGIKDMRETFDEDERPEIARELQVLLSVLAIPEVDEAVQQVKKWRLNQISNNN